MSNVPGNDGAQIKDRVDLVARRSPARLIRSRRKICALYDSLRRIKNSLLVRPGEGGTRVTAICWSEKSS